MNVTHYLTRPEESMIAEIKRLRTLTGQRNVSDAEIIRAAATTGLRHDLETMRIVAEAFERGDVPA